LLSVKSHCHGGTGMTQKKTYNKRNVLYHICFKFFQSGTLHGKCRILSRQYKCLIMVVTWSILVITQNRIYTHDSKALLCKMCTIATLYST
jgi:hypothetical protein